MPNPFLRLGSPNQSKGNEDRSTPTGAIEPEPEHVAGTVFAYRGMENHGVETNSAYRDPEYVEQAEVRSALVYMEPEEEPTPVPVRIVDSSSREMPLFRTVHAFAGGTTERLNAVNICPADLQSMTRRRVYVRNMSAKRIYLGNDQSTANAMNGWPLEAGETWDTDSVDDIWAFGTDTTVTPQELALRIEYSVPVNA